MKKKLIFVAMITILLALTFISCEQPSEEGWKITVTDIPGTTGYNYGYVNLATGTITNPTQVAGSYPKEISSGKLTIELLHKSDLSIFTDEGTYIIVLVLTSDNKGETRVYSGWTQNRTIKGDYSISFNSFNIF